MGELNKNLLEKDIHLPELPKSKGNYILYKKIDDMIYVSGQSAFQDGGALYPGQIGKEVTVEQGYEAARMTGKVILAILQEAAGNLERIQIEKVLGFVASAPGFCEQPAVLDGLSDLFVEVLGERGRHVRSAIGTSQLPFQCCVEAETIARIID